MDKVGVVHLLSAAVQTAFVCGVLVARPQPAGFFASLAVGATVATAWQTVQGVLALMRVESFGLRPEVCSTLHGLCSAAMALTAIGTLKESFVKWILVVLAVPSLLVLIAGAGAWCRGAVQRAMQDKYVDSVGRYDVFRRCLRATGSSEASVSKFKKGFWAAMQAAAAAAVAGAAAPGTSSRRSSGVASGIRVPWTGDAFNGAADHLTVTPALTFAAAPLTLVPQAVPKGHEDNLLSELAHVEWVVQDGNDAPRLEALFDGVAYALVVCTRVRAMTFPDAAFKWRRGSWGSAGPPKPFDGDRLVVYMRRSELSNPRLVEGRGEEEMNRGRLDARVPGVRLLEDAPVDRISDQEMSDQEMSDL
jgi:hypothetical protein